MKLPDVVEPEPERPFAQLLWSLRRLGFPLLPHDVRLARIQEVVDREASRKALRVFGLEGVTVTGLGSVPPGDSSVDSLELRPSKRGGPPLSRWSRTGRLGWDGQLLTVESAAGDVVRLRPSGDGVQPGYRADEVARTGVRPSPALTECPSAVVEIAAVAVEGQRMQRLLFLDEASRCLAVTPGAPAIYEGTDRARKDRVVTSDLASRLCSNLRSR
jgi:hypothetical protein